MQYGWNSVCTWLKWRFQPTTLWLKLVRTAQCDWICCNRLQPVVMYIRKLRQEQVQNTSLYPQSRLSPCKRASTQPAQVSFSSSPSTAKSKPPTAQELYRQRLQREEEEEYAYLPLGWSIMGIRASWTLSPRREFLILTLLSGILLISLDC